eukprot:m51a1_g2859 putative gdp-d-mannose pyrophosphorylase (361) ;mRNA; r:335605-337561
MGLKALILVGGYGTRLRPLTITVPKPIVEVANKALIVHQIEALAAVGVTDVVLAVSYKPDTLASYLQPFSSTLGVNLIYSQDEVPMGTAGPLALARKHLEGSGPFFVMNSDVICPFPLKQLLEFHKSRAPAALGTILVTQVEEPSKYGVVVFDEATGNIRQFVEKPKRFVGNKINAGIYCLDPAVLDLIEPRRMSIEREVFPRVAEKGALYAMVLDGFWADVGQPRDYLVGTALYLASLDASRLRQGADVVPPVLVDPTAKIGEGCVLGPNVVVGPGCVVGNGVRLANATLLEGSVVREHAWISNSIIGWRSTVGKWARVDNGTVLAEDVHVFDELFVNGALVLPHKDVNTCVTAPTIIM